MSSSVEDKGWALNRAHVLARQMRDAIAVHRRSVFMSGKWTLGEMTFLDHLLEKASEAEQSLDIVMGRPSSRPPRPIRRTKSKR
jgi:hypothetical protein